MERYIAAQTREFLLAIVLGLALGLLYDVLRAGRMARGRGGRLRGLTDLLYCAMALLSFIAFMLSVGQGEMRGYIFAAAALGQALYYLALSAAMRFWLIPLIRAVFFLAGRIKSGIFALFTPSRGN